MNAVTLISIRICYITLVFQKNTHMCVHVHRITDLKMFFFVTFSCLYAVDRSVTIIWHSFKKALGNFLKASLVCLKK